MQLCTNIQIVFSFGSFEAWGICIGFFITQQTSSRGKNMKSKNLNNSSKKTCKLIKSVFAELIAEKQELGKISVSELCARADISRGAFYSHYDDIYSVAEDYENELIDAFFDNATLISAVDVYQFIDTFFGYIKANHQNYRLLCRSNDMLFAAKRLTGIISGKFLELCNNDSRIRNKKYVELEINVFVEGLLCEYIKFCRNYVSYSFEELHDYTVTWVNNFLAARG